MKAQVVGRILISAHDQGCDPGRGTL